MPPTDQDVLIRAEEAADVAAIRQVNEAAFGRPNEADIVDALRQGNGVIASLVAVTKGQITNTEIHRELLTGYNSHL